MRGSDDFLTKNAIGFDGTERLATGFGNDTLAQINDWQLLNQSLAKTTMIDLKEFETRLKAFLDDGLSRFEKEYPSETATTIGLYSCPWSGWVSLCVNCGDTDTEHERNCPDFDHVEYDLVEFPEWEEEYNSDTPTVRISESETFQPGEDEGDEGYNEPFYEFLKRFATAYFPQRERPPIWVGVQMLDSEFVDYWKLG